MHPWPEDTRLYQNKCDRKLKSDGKQTTRLQIVERHLTKSSKEMM